MCAQLAAAAAPHLDSLLPEQVEKARRAMAPRTAAGFDGMSSELMRGVGVEANSSLTALLTGIVQHGQMPAFLTGPRIATIPKPAGGFRPISVLPMMYRVLARALSGVLSDFGNSAVE